MPAVFNEDIQFLSVGGKPLVGGRIYIGEVNSDPVAVPKAIFSDRELTTPLANPQVIDATGRATNKIWLSGRYSIQVNDENGVQVFQDLDRGENESDIAGIPLGNVIGGDTITAEGTPTQTAYTDKEMYIFTVAQVNTGAVTLNIDGIGARPIVKNERNPLIAGDLVVGENISVVYNEGNDEFVMVKHLPALAGHLFGLTLSNDSGDTEHDIAIAVGEAASDDASSRKLLMSLNTAIVKQIDAAWTVGTNQGGLDTGTVAADTWYHVFLIMRSDTGVVDALFSTSPTAPTLPANYDKQRRIGSVLTDSSSNIIAFQQDGDFFAWETIPLDNNTNNTSAARQTFTASTPLGLRLQARLAVALQASAASTFLMNIASPDKTDETPTLGNSQLSFRPPSTTATTAGQVEVYTNTSSEITFRFNVTTTVGVVIGLEGWTDRRGRLS